VAPKRPEPEREAAAPWRSRTFGVELDLCFPMPALIAAERPSGAPGCRLELALDEQIDAGWPFEEAQLRGLMSDGTARFEIHEHPVAGYLIDSSRYGRFRVSRDGAEVACAPNDPSGLHWWGLLIGQVLPLVAVLHGLEVLHASAVAIDGRAFAFSGMPGAGKSTLALNLGLAGAPLLCDDVIALRAQRERVIAEPGSALVNLRDDQLPLLDERNIDELGTVLGSTHKLHLRAARLAPPTPLGALYLLEPADPGATTTIDLVDPVDPRDLLAATFVPYVSFAHRLIAQMEIAALIGRSVPVFRVSVDRGAGPQALALQIHEHAIAT
jgi:hypothetical protein